MTKRIRFLSVVGAFTLVIFGAGAQDIHHSQFYTAPLLYNPSVTGLFKGDQRLNLNFRKQWFVNNAGNFLTLAGSYEFKIYPKKWTQKGIWNAGLQFAYDQAGDSKLGLAQLGLAVSYAYPINSHNLVSAGAMAALSHRRFKPDELTWDAQWNGSVFDPGLPSGELFEKNSNLFPDFSAGVAYRWQKSSRTRLDLGIAAFHLNRPNQQFFDQSLSVKLPVRLSVQALPSIQIAESFDFMLHGLYQRQQSFEELLAGAYLRMYLNQKRGKELDLYLGCSLRNGDAIIPKLGVRFREWYGAVSYDITNSPFKEAVDGQGGPEFSLTYVYAKARPLVQLKSCPVF
ncbi:MAG: PorP/SprF family type IX secretion system membrane protein [Saprospiraceae bacterium]|nr:PorP/SprF family type IX secretion system membrane protein [Saprospiraceae bacterium]